MNRHLLSFTLISALIASTGSSSPAESPNPNKRTRPEDFSEQRNLQPIRQIRRITTTNHTTTDQTNTLQPIQPPANTVAILPSLISTLTQFFPNTSAIGFNNIERTTDSLSALSTITEEENETSNTSSRNLYQLDFSTVSPASQEEDQLLATLLAFAYPENWNLPIKEQLEKAVKEDQLTINFLNSTPKEQIQSLHTLWQDLYESEEDEDLVDEGKAAQEIIRLIEHLLPLSATKYIAAVMLEKIKFTPINANLKIEILEKTASLWRPFLERKDVKEKIENLLSQGSNNKQLIEKIRTTLNQESPSLSPLQKDRQFAAEVQLQTTNKRSCSQIRNVLNLISALPPENQVLLIFRNFEKFNLRNLKCRLIEITSLFTWIELIAQKLQEPIALQQLARVAIRFSLQNQNIKIKSHQKPITTDLVKQNITSYAKMLKQHILCHEYLRLQSKQCSIQEILQDHSSQLLSNSITEQTKHIVTLADTKFINAVQNNRVLAQPVVFRYGYNMTDIFSSRVPSDTYHLSKILELIATQNNNPQALILFLNRIQKVKSNKQKVQLLAPISFLNLKTLDTLNAYFDCINTLSNKEQFSLLFRSRSLSQSYHVDENALLKSPKVTKKFFETIKNFDDKQKEILMGSEYHCSLLFAKQTTNRIDLLQEIFTTNIPLQQFINEFIKPIKDPALQTAILSQESVINEYIIHQNANDFEAILTYINTLDASYQAEIIKALLYKINTQSTLRPLNLEAYYNPKNYRQIMFFLSIFNWIAGKSIQEGLLFLSRSKKLVQKLFTHYNEIVESLPGTFAPHTFYQIIQRYLDPSIQSPVVKQLQAKLAAILIRLSQNNWSHIASNVLTELKHLEDDTWERTKTVEESAFCISLIEAFIKRPSLIPPYNHGHITSPAIWQQTHERFGKLLDYLLVLSGSKKIKTQGLESKQAGFKLIRRIRSYYQTQDLTPLIEAKLQQSAATLPQEKQDAIKKLIIQFFDFIFNASQANIHKIFTEKEQSFSHQMLACCTGENHNNNEIIAPAPDKALLEFINKLEDPENIALKQILDPILTPQFKRVFRVLQTTQPRACIPPAIRCFSDAEIYFDGPGIF